MKRLQLGAGGLHQIAQPHVAPLLNSTWVHLGDGFSEPAKLSSKQKLKQRLLPAYRRLRGLPVIDFKAVEHQLRHDTTYLPFYYRQGDQLDFPAGAFSFIFSEHFFEHLRLDQAASLFQECHRLLRPGGVLRTVVPDADLRTYEPAEKPGNTRAGTGWTDPNYHKTRWSVYSLTYILQSLGFKTNPVVYCDENGQYHYNIPLTGDFYKNVADPEVVHDFKYIRRLRTSLIVDALKV